MTHPPDPTGQRSDAVGRRGSLALGLLLVVVGLAFLAVRQWGLDLAGTGWPLFVIVPGLVLFAAAFLVGGRPGTGFAVAGAVTVVTGVILAVQNATGLWATWAYAWALVAPGGVGLGLLVYGTLIRQRDLALGGGWSVLVALAIFLVGAFFFESVLGLSGNRIQGLDTLLAGALVLLGMLVIGFGLLGGRRRVG